MLTLTLMQGPSGGGKSTVAILIAPFNQSVVCSTDDYFYERGVYNFNPKRLPEFHLLNQVRVHEFLRNGTSVIVDNTNLQNWEIRNYVRSAKEFGAKIVIIRVDGRFENKHGVPADRVQAMRERMENLDPEIAVNAKAPWEK